MTTIVELESIYKGYKYKIVFNLIYGYRCGYVQIPEEHPYYQKDYREFSDICRYGGLTYSGFLDDNENFYVGFDCAYACFGFDSDALKKYLPLDNALQQIEYIKQFKDENLYTPSLEECEEECKNIINKLIKEN